MEKIIDLILDHVCDLIRSFGRYIAGAVGAIIAALEPSLPIFLICTVMVFIDCYTAWALSRRVKIKYPDKKKDGKFKSNYAGRVFVTLIKIYIGIALAHYIQVNITNAFFVIELPKIVAGAFVFWNVWSICENESSCSDKKWAKILQKIMVDKTERHFDIDLSDLKTKETEENG